MRISVEERHERILALVRERGSIRVAQLAEELRISTETARRDVTALAEVGRLRRAHGSVAWPGLPLSARDARLAGDRRAPDTAELVLGMVVPAAGYFYGQVLRGARAAAAAAGVRLLVGVTDYRQTQDAVQVGNLVEAGAQGLLLTPGWAPAGPGPVALAQLAELPVPTVLVERRPPLGAAGVDLDRVGSDHAGGAALAVRHLAALGHRRIALMTLATHTSDAIRLGYRAATAALGLPDDEVSRPSDPSDPSDPGNPGDPGGDLEALDRARERLFELIATQGVRAALVHTDHVAMNLLQQLRVRGLRVPEDFAVVCYDDELATLADVPMTAVAPSKSAVGEAGVSLLLRRIAKPSAGRRHIELLPELTVRESCGAQLAAVDNCEFDDR